MKKQTDRIVRRLFVPVGVCLLAAAIASLFWWQWGIRASEQKMQTCVQTIRTLIPQPQGAVPEQRRDNTMPVLSLDGTDFVGMLEMPRHGACVPVCADWGAVTKYPCRFGGSVYDRTMQIGATSQKGQFDFYREISAGDTVFFTDAEGNRYSYAVTDIHYENHADQAALGREEAALTLFIKNMYGFEYIVIFCNTLA